MSGRMLRPEARPLELEELSLSQLQTLDLVVRSMAEAHEQLPSTGRQEGDSTLDSKRSSRLFFVSGEPGIGKTTIYTTLRHLLPDRRVAREQRKVSEADAFKYGNDKRAKLKLQIREKINQLAGGVRWLEPLDLEPLSGSTNFLASVMVRIERALEAGHDLKSRASVGGLLDRSSETGKALAELNRFQNDLAMSWDGNLQARAAHVEPDTYAAEVLRAENARLSVNWRLQEILSKLMPVGEEKGRKSTLFLLVVDDLYLNPASSIELLRLLRMISSPQLFVLLLGDYDTLEYLFYQQTLGDYIKLAGGAAFTAFERGLKDEIKSRAWTLAAGSLRKLVPPKQKTDLSSLWIDEALGFRAIDARQEGTQEKNELKYLLKRLHIGQAGFPANVQELVTAGWKTEQEGAKQDWGIHAYSGALLLEMPPRHATDMWMKLADNEEDALPIEKTVGIVGDEFHAALNEQSRVWGKQKKQLELAVTRGNARKILEEYVLNTNSLSMKVELHDVIKKDVNSDVHGSTPGTTKIHAPTQIDWAMQSNGKELDIPPRLLGWLVVLHDVLVLGRPQNLVGEHLVGRNGDFRWVGFSWKLKDGRDGGSTESDVIYWPAPEWKTFLEFDLLRWAWNVLVDEGNGQSIRWEVRAFRWFDAICSILTKEKDPGSKDKEFVRKELVHFANPSMPFDDSLWTGLVERIRSLAITDGKDSKIVRDWVVDVGVVVALRLGIPEDVAECFEQDQELNGFWRKDPEIRGMRNNAPGKRGWHAHVAKYFPEAWPPPLPKKVARAQVRGKGKKA